MTTVLDERRPVANKRHHCNGCLGVISPGEHYVIQKIVDGSEFWTWKAHELCDAIHLQLTRSHHYFDDEFPDPCEVHEVIRDLLGGLLLAGAE